MYVVVQPALPTCIVFSVCHIILLHYSLVSCIVVWWYCILWYCVYVLCCVCYVSNYDGMVVLVLCIMYVMYVINYDGMVVLYR